MNMFTDYEESVKKEAIRIKNHKDEIEAKEEPLRKALFSISKIDDVLSNINTLDKEYLQYYIKFYFNDLVEQLKSQVLLFDRFDQLVVGLFTNDRFISTLMNLIPEIKKEALPSTISSLCFCITRMLQVDTNASLYALIQRVNSEILDSLSRELRDNYNPSIVTDIILARYTSDSPYFAIPKINTVICERTSLSPTEIISVYYQFYKSMSDTLIGVMHDVVDIKNKHSKYQEQYGRISLAILEYLEMQTSEVLTKSLSNYSMIHSMKYRDSPIRFSILTVYQPDYPRIFAAYNYLKDNGIIVP